MPQNLNKLWQKDLGEKYQVIHDKYLHTIGNLTQNMEISLLKKSKTWMEALSKVL